MILPYWEIFKRKETSKTLWFNQDPIPEIDKSLSEKYLKVIMSNKNASFYQLIKSHEILMVLELINIRLGIYENKNIN